MKANPCKTCEERTPTCHGECVPYKEWAKEHRQEVIQTNRAKASLGKMYDYGGKWRRCVYLGRRK